MMGTALLRILVLVLSLLLNVNSRVLRENNPWQGVGFSAEEQRIVGGQMASLEQFPFVAALHYNGRFICTSSIISSTLILTAGHCVVLNGRQQDPSLFHVNYGTTKRSLTTKQANIRSIAVHPEFLQTSLGGDIAVMRTTAPMQLDNKTAKAICLMKNRSSSYTYGTSAGWGITRQGPPAATPIPPPPEDLYYVRLRISSLEGCKNTYPNTITERHICTESPDYWIYKGVCSGDSGGPFFSDEDRLQIGVASFVHGGYGCGYPYYQPGTSVCTFVPFFVDWVNTTTRDAEICYA